MGHRARRQRTQLNTFHAAAFDERDRILEVVMCILRAVWREDAARRHRLTVDRFDNSHFVGANLDQRHFAHDFFKRKLDQVQAGFQHVGLNTNFAFSGYHSSRRHFCAEVSSFFDRDFARADVDEDALHDDEEEIRRTKAPKSMGNTDAISKFCMVFLFQVQLEAVDG